MLKVPLVCLLSRHSLAVPVVKEKIWKKCLKQNNQSVNFYCCLQIGGKKTSHHLISEQDISFQLWRCLKSCRRTLETHKHVT